MTPALKETFHDIEGWACDVDVAMGALDTVRVMVMLAAKAEGLDADDARTALHKMNDLLDELHNDLDVLQETMRLILKKAA
jgi:hypothetical protein